MKTIWISTAIRISSCSPPTRYAQRMRHMALRETACTDDTDAIQSAIDTVWKRAAAPSLPGTEEEENEQTKFYGRRYRITNLLLRSRVELHFEKGAVLWQSPVYRDYKYAPVYGHDMAVPNVNWTHCLHVANLPTIQCANSEYVKITGFGKIAQWTREPRKVFRCRDIRQAVPTESIRFPSAFTRRSGLSSVISSLCVPTTIILDYMGAPMSTPLTSSCMEVRCVSGDWLWSFEGLPSCCAEPEFSPVK